MMVVVMVAVVGLLLAACAGAPAGSSASACAGAGASGPGRDSLPVVLAHTALATSAAPRCERCRSAAAFAACLRAVGLADPFAPAPWRADADVLVVVTTAGQGAPPLTVSVGSEEGVDVVTLAPAAAKASPSPSQSPSAWAHFVVLEHRPCQLAVVWREPDHVGERTLRVFGRDD